MMAGWRWSGPRNLKWSRLMATKDELFWAARTHMVLDALIQSGLLKRDLTKFRAEYSELVEPEDGPEVRQLAAYMASAKAR